MMAVGPTTSPARLALTFDRAAQIKTAVIGVLFIATFWHLLDFVPPLGALVHAWRYEMDWSHGPLIPVFAAYLVYLKWNHIRRCRVRYTWIGFLIILIGLAVYLWALSGQLRFGYAKPFSMMV